MKIIIKIPLILLVLIALSSCETTIDYDLPQEPSKITIDSKLLTNDTPVVSIFTSIYALSNDPPGISENAQVVLFENGASVSKLTLRKNIYGQTYYSSNYKISPNQLYKVQASIPGYTNAYGQTTTRDAVPISSLKFDSITNDLTFAFQDPTTKGDHYMITVWDSAQGDNVYYSTNDVVLNFFDGDYFDDPFGGSQEKSGLHGYLSDQYFNGNNKSIRITIADYYESSTKPNYQIELWRISKDLYEHNRTKSIAWTSDNPFSEPVQVYSNIENGYGIVGSVAVSKKQFYP